MSARPAQIANIVYGASGAGQPAQACERAQLDNAGFAYVTDLAERPNPYATLPSYWAGEAEDC